MSNAIEFSANRLAYSVADFCKSHSISRATYYVLRKKGLGPRVMHVGGKPLISTEAAADWRKIMEGGNCKFANAVQQAAT